MKDLKDYVVDESIIGRLLLKIVLQSAEVLIVTYIAKLIQNNIIKINDYPIDTKAVQCIANSADNDNPNEIKVDNPQTAISFALILEHISETWNKYIVLNCLITKDKFKKIVADFKSKAYKLARKENN